MASQALLVQEQCDYAVVSVTDNTTTVYTGPCMLYGVYVNTALSAHALPIQDGATTVVSLAASSAIGVNPQFPGVKFNTSLIVNPNDSGTGSVTIAYRPVNPASVDIGAIAS